MPTTRLGQHHDVAPHAWLHFIGAAKLPTKADDTHMLAECQAGYVDAGRGADKDLDGATVVIDVKLVTIGQLIAHRLCNHAVNDDQTTFGGFVDLQLRA